jgi:hypothetical protein
MEITGDEALYLLAMKTVHPCAPYETSSPEEIAEAGRAFQRRVEEVIEDKLVLMTMPVNEDVRIVINS